MEPFLLAAEKIAETAAKVEKTLEKAAEIGMAELGTAWLEEAELALSELPEELPVELDAEIAEEPQQMLKEAQLPERKATGVTNLLRMDGSCSSMLSGLSRMREAALREAAQAKYLEAELSESLGEMVEKQIEAESLEAAADSAMRSKRIFEMTRSLEHGVRDVHHAQLHR